METVPWGETHMEWTVVFTALTTSKHKDESESICDIWNKLNKYSTPTMALTTSWPPCRPRADYFGPHLSEVLTTCRFFFYMLSVFILILDFFCSGAGGVHSYSTTHSCSKLPAFRVGVLLFIWLWVKHRVSNQVYSTEAHQQFQRCQPETNTSATKREQPTMLVTKGSYQKRPFRPTFTSKTVCKALVLAGSAWGWVRRWSSWGGTR